MNGPATRIPLTVIGGFLGAGKTTLLNHLLLNGHGRRWVVLVNDFGQINVDAELVQSRSAQVMRLSNGCVCCQIGDDLADALARAVESRPAPDAIVIEASGVSDPWRIAQVGLADPALALDGVIVLVDATMVRRQYADALLSDTIARQLASADLLVVNKCDLVDADERDALRAWLTGVAAGAPVFETVDGKVPRILLSEPLPARVGSDGRWEYEADVADEEVEHGQVFETWHLAVPRVFEADALKRLLRQMPAGVLRLKGLVRTGPDRVDVLQFAGRHGSLRPYVAAQSESGSTPAAHEAGACGETGGLFTGAPAGAGMSAPPARPEWTSTFVAIGLKGKLPREELGRAILACASGPAIFHEIKTARNPTPPARSIEP